MSNQSESDRLQVLYDAELTNFNSLTTQIASLVASGVTYQVGDQSFDFNGQLIALNNLKNNSLNNLKSIIELQNIKNPYYMIGRGC